MVWEKASISAKNWVYRRKTPIYQRKTGYISESPSIYQRKNTYISTKNLIYLSKTRYIRQKNAYIHQKFNISVKNQIYQRNPFFKQNP
jgi:hypothetical protein